MQKDKYQCSRDLNPQQHVIQLCAMLHKSNGRGTNHKQKAFTNTGMLLYGIFLLNLKAYRLITVYWQPQNHFISFWKIIQIYQHSITCKHMYVSMQIPWMIHTAQQGPPLVCLILWPLHHLPLCNGTSPLQISTTIVTAKSDTLLKFGKLHHCKVSFAVQ